MDGLIGLHDVYQNHLELFFLMIDLLLDLLKFLDYFGVGLSHVLPQFLQLLAFLGVVFFCDFVGI